MNRLLSRGVKFSSRGNNFFPLNKNNTGLSFNRTRLFSSNYPAHEVVGLPALSPTMESGTIVRWLKAEGDEIKAGDIICEVETDKATVDYEAQDESFLAKILQPQGSSDIKVGEPMCIMVEEKDDLAAFQNYSIEASSTSSAPSAPPAPAAEAESPASPVAAAPVSAPTNSVDQSVNGRVFASPLARKAAREAGISIVSIVGSGPNGRIINEDVAYAIEHGQAAETSSSTPAPESVQQVALPTPSAYHEGDYTDLPVSEHAQRIAQELAEQKLHVPHYHLSVDLTLDKLLDAREKLNATRDANEQLSVNDFILRAVSLAVKTVPEVNAAWMGSFIRQYRNTNISFVISGPSGTVCPVLEATNQKGLHDISSDVRGFVQRVEEQSAFSVNETQNGTFTVSNVGMYDVTGLATIIPANQACALGLGTIQKKVVPNDDPDAEVIYKYATMMNATLACDHRVIDGATGAQYLAAFKKLVEDPLQMIL